MPAPIAQQLIGGVDPSRVVAHFQVEMNPVPRRETPVNGNAFDPLTAGFRIEVAPRGIDVRLVMYHLAQTECTVHLQPIPNGRGRFYMSELLPRKFRIVDGDTEVVIDLVIVNLNAHGGPAAAILGGGGRLRVWASRNFPSQQIDLVA